MGKRRQKFPNQTVERLTALRGILNMHERAIKAGEACKLNGEARKFNMDTWDCGTAACALGSAAFHPWFKERGLHPGPSACFASVPTYKNKTSCKAGAEFFGIAFTESLYLFSVGEYKENAENISPSVVRARVDKLVEKYSK